MASLMTVLYVVLGYVLRHFDLIKIHVPLDPLKQAVAEHEKQQKDQLRAELLAKLGAVKPTPPASPPSAG